MSTTHSLKIFHVVQCLTLPVETNLKLETDKTDIPKNSGQGAGLVTDVLYTRVRSPCWSLSELQEWLEKVARVDLLEHDKKRDLWSLAIQELDVTKLPRTADPPIIISHNVLSKMRRLLWKTCCVASSTIHLLLDNREFGCKSHQPTPTLPKWIHVTLSKAEQSWARTSADRLKAFALAVTQANDTSRAHVEQLPVSRPAAIKACAAHSYYRCQLGAYARGESAASSRDRILSKVIWPDERAIIKVAKEVNCTFPFHVKNWAVEEHSEEALRNPWYSYFHAGSQSPCQQKGQYQLHSSW